MRELLGVGLSYRAARHDGGRPCDILGRNPEAELIARNTSRDDSHHAGTSTRSRSNRARCRRANDPTDPDADRQGGRIAANAPGANAYGPRNEILIDPGTALRHDGGGRRSGAT
jgi:hypothetical protein